ncbi:thiol:disulfide interchange protein, partial [Salinisphaera sp. PC39]|uniref:cytochrome c biogenesis protein CcdA n=1 Tax=Salinisphaera sp. PC39 TaxID=1304156 RepID=UPI003340F5DC
MNGPRRLLAALCLLWPALAAAAGGGLLGGGGNDFLSVDEAFRPSVERTGDGRLAAAWDIASGYYLYRHAFEFELAEAGDAALGEPAIPAGEKHQDEFFGEVETYRDRVVVTLPVTGALPPGTELRVGYQGCADAGLCYPPQTRTLSLDGTTATAAPAGDSDNTGERFVAEQDRLASRLADGDLLWSVLTFLGLGLLLAFTPCVLPMLPILSGLIVGAHAGRADRRTAAARGLALSLAYVIAMAVAYTVFGILAGLLGANLQAALQSPWALVPFALIFVGLALAMFGVYELQLPSS